MRHAATLAVLLWLAATSSPGVAGQLPQPANARVETRSAATGLASVVTAEVKGRPGPFWIGWSVATNLDHSSCCWSGEEAGGASCRGCRLEGKGAFVGTSDEAKRLEGAGRVRVLLRAEGGRVGRIRAFSEDCPLDASGLTLVWIEDVRPAESVAWLASLVGQPREGGSGGKRLDDGGLSAIAFHADPSADAALERFAAAPSPRELRRQAIFWLGQARGAHGSQVVKRILRDDPDRDLREHAIFALSQSREPGAVDAIIEAARRDPDGHVRGQALFSLAQTASKRAPDAIRAALDEDPEVGVKKKAVFALSQLPRDEGVPLLIGVAKAHSSAAVREQAMFWLGQSGDPRALAFFEDVLGR